MLPTLGGKLNENSEPGQGGLPRPLFMTAGLCYKTITRQGPSWILLSLMSVIFSPFGLSFKFVVEKSKSQIQKLSWIIYILFLASVASS